MSVEEKIRGELRALSEEEYRRFSCPLIPTLAVERVLGVRLPNIRALAKKLGREEREAFFAALPHYYQEENMLHAVLISAVKDYERSLVLLEDFLPHVDNWGVCDSLRPASFKKNRASLLEKIKLWLNSEHSYTVRFGLEMLMTHYLDEDFDRACLELAASVRSEDYYINMMQAWYFATALAKQYAAALPYIERRRLSPWVHNKTVQKAIESYRLSPEHKAALRALRIKKER